MLCSHITMHVSQISLHTVVSIKTTSMVHFHVFVNFMFIYLFLMYVIACSTRIQTGITNMNLSGMPPCNL